MCVVLLPEWGEFLVFLAPFGFCHTEVAETGSVLKLSDSLYLIPMYVCVMLINVCTNEWMNGWMDEWIDG